MSTSTITDSNMEPPDVPGTPPNRQSMTATATATAPTADTPPTCLCPNCGFAVDVPNKEHARHDSSSSSDTQKDELRRAREQIGDLEAQVRVLSQKAAAAADRLADYEDEMVKLRQQINGGGPSTPVIASPTSPTHVRSSFLPAGAASRLSALLSPRSAKSTPNLKAAAAAAAAAPPVPMPALPATPVASTAPTSHASTSSYASSASSPPPPPPRSPMAWKQPLPSPMGVPNTQELLAALAREQALRRQAEGRLQDTSREVEELSVSLFEQANEMVADERRARARLEARVAVLERRDTDKAQRLARLEAAMNRIERLRRLLDETTAETESVRSSAAEFEEMPPPPPPKESKRESTDTTLTMTTIKPTPPPATPATPPSTTTTTTTTTSPPGLVSAAA